MEPGDINFVDMPPPDMPSALAAGAIDAYFIGEPHAAKAELAGTGPRALPREGHLAALRVVRAGRARELIDEQPDVVRDLVRGIAESGEWAERNRLDAAKVAAPYFRQDQKLLEYVLTQPPDRVSYRHLTPTDEDIAGDHEVRAQAAGILAPADPAERPRRSPLHPDRDRTGADRPSREADAERGSASSEATRPSGARASVTRTTFSPKPTSQVVTRSSPIVSSFRRSTFVALPRGAMLW